MEIPLIGWSTDSVPDWFVDVKLSPASASQADWHAQIVDAAVAQGAWYQPFYNAGPTLNNGKTATLRVTVPADSAPASFYVESYRGSPPPRGFDWSHLWKLEVQVAP